MKIFRKARINMIDTQRIKAYLAYSLGEIVLVVIGILIALSINNWNSDRKQQRKLHNIFTIVAEDIRTDTTELGVILRDYQKRESLFMKLLGDSLSYEEFKDCRECKILATSFSKFTLNQNGKKNLEEYSSELGNDSLTMQIIQIYESIDSGIDIIGQPVSDDVYQLLTLWRDKYDWYASIISGKMSEEHVKYLFEDRAYKNRLAHHYLLVFGNYVPALEGSQKELIKLLTKIENRIEAVD